MVDGALHFTHTVLRPKITLATRRAASTAKDLIGIAEGSCIISISIKTHVIDEPVIEYGSGNLTRFVAYPSHLHLSFRVFLSSTPDTPPM